MAFRVRAASRRWILVPGFADDGAAGPLVWLVSKSEFTVEDDWYVTGFVAAGSNAVSLNETFVPDHRSHD
jgi:alkylation response protein AidB-like acyl-CoA dehydrogenase